MEPSESPAPTRLCTSSINRIIFPSRFTSSTKPFTRLSNCPRNCVPATSAAKSSRKTSLSWRRDGAFPSAIFNASPSTIAVFPTPGSPIKQGLFLLRLPKICSRRSVSRSRPMILSKRPCLAFSVKFSQKLSRYFLRLRFLERSSACCCWLRVRIGSFSSGLALSALAGSGDAEDSDDFSSLLFPPPNNCCKNGNGCACAPPISKPSSPWMLSKASSICSPMASISSSVIPIFSIISFTGWIPSSFAHFRHKPSFTVLSPSRRVIKTTAIRFLQRLHTKFIL